MSIVSWAILEDRNYESMELSTMDQKKKKKGRGVNCGARLSQLVFQIPSVTKCFLCGSDIQGFPQDAISPDSTYNPKKYCNFISIALCFICSMNFVWGTHY